jgi:hypothetical protein
MAIMVSLRDTLHAAVRDASMTYVGLQIIIFITFSFLVLGVMVLFIDNAEWLINKINHCLHPPVMITGEEEVSGEEQVDSPTELAEAAMECHANVAENTLNKV